MRLRACAMKPATASRSLEMPVEFPVPEPCPVRKRRHQALEERGEDLVEVRLDHFVVGFERVDVDAEASPK